MDFETSHLNRHFSSNLDEEKEERRSRSLAKYRFSHKSLPTFLETEHRARLPSILVLSHRETCIKMVKNDDFEYHITYPSDNRSADDERTPVIVLIGWYACIDKHLSKYSAIYDDLGYITMRFIPNKNLIMYRPREYDSVASRLLRILSESDLQGHPIFFKTFSNGGTYIYDHIARQLSSNKDHGFNVKGNMFDSAPAIASLYNLYLAVNRSSSGGAIQRALIGYFVVVYAALYITYFTVKCLLTGKGFYKSPSVEMYASLKDDPLRHPQLLLYSKSDDICESKYLEEFREFRSGLGVKVFEKCWMESPHVLHYPYHKDEYVQTVKDFIDYCLTHKANRNGTNGELSNGYQHEKK